MSVLLLSGTRVVAAGGGGGGGSNEPAGFTTLVDNPMSTVPPFGSADAFGFRRYDNVGTRLSVQTDGDGGVSNPNYLRLLFPTGMTGGSYDSPFTAGTNFNSPSGRTQLYTRIRFRVSSNWTDNGNANTKFFFFLQQPEGSGNNHYIDLTEAGALQPALKMQSTFAYAGPSGPNYRMASPLAKGTWHTLECLFIANTPGSYNGVFKMWANNTLVVNETTIGYFASGQTAEWFEFWCNPTYGGGTNQPPVDMSLDIDHWYTSAKA